MTTRSSHSALHEAITAAASHGQVIPAHILSFVDVRLTAYNKHSSPHPVSQASSPYVRHPS